MPTIADLVAEYYLQNQADAEERGKQLEKTPTMITLFPLREQWRVVRGKRFRFPESEGTGYLLRNFIAGVYSSSEKAEAEQERREASASERLRDGSEEEK